MLAPTHSVFGIFLTLIILAVFGIQWSLHWSIILFAIFGAILPDIDHPRSVIGKMFSFISIPLERRYGHRTITHSLIGWAISTAVFGFVIMILVWILGFISNLGFSISDLAPRWISAFSISYFSHLVLDMFNPRGSQLLWPDQSRDVIPRNAKFRPESGSRVEVLFFFIIFALMLLAFPISKYGISSSLRWLLAIPGSAIEEFKSQKTHSYLEFKGVLSETKQPIEGTAEILDSVNKRLVIRYKNNIYTLSDELAADILATHVRVKRTLIPIKIQYKEFKDKTYEYLLSQIPKDALVSGTVQLPKGMEIKFPVFTTTYKIMEQKGDDLILRFVTKDQIKKLALSDFFEIQRRKDIADLSKLRADADKIRVQIKNIHDTQGLTPLGKEILQNKDDSEKQRTQLAQLKSELEGANIRTEETNLKIKNTKFIFSCEVYFRQ